MLLPSILNNLGFIVAIISEIKLSHVRIVLIIFVLSEWRLLLGTSVGYLSELDLDGATLRRLFHFFLHHIIIFKLLL